ncbi:hypothetical protein [Bradyrhizobium retamae]|uniref:Uncharacterized protein n=1 Tax=Bradyrhizobium retamae TaxID=1300035 RepID=A0A0R3NBT9_9BRAD|nr:hypothetical protein [Bradyrhizobium retamae]KRR29630.1 hypothetical protein CQ13_38340 [Bradyrhizobium retamae]
MIQKIEIGEGGNVAAASATLVEAPSVSETTMTGHQPQIAGFAAVFTLPEEVRAADVAPEVIRRYERRLGAVQAPSGAGSETKGLLPGAVE